MDSDMSIDGEFRLIAICMAAALLICSVDVGYCSSSWDMIPLQRAPTPQITDPKNEVVDLSGKQHLEFKWRAPGGATSGRRYFDLRLYKGYVTTAPFLLLKERIDPARSVFMFDSGLFEDGCVYTVTIRQLYFSRLKSRPAKCSFTAIKGH